MKSCSHVTSTPILLAIDICAFSILTSFDHKLSFVLFFLLSFALSFNNTLKFLKGFISILKTTVNNL